jgi:3-methyladenine DNA glycosylase AlkD
MVRSLRAAGRSDKHLDLQHYVGSPLPTLGVYTRDLEAVRRDFRTRHPQLLEADLHALTSALWEGTYFEERLLACLLLETFPRTWTGATWSLTGRWVDQAVGWGLCDTLAGGVISRQLAATPSRFQEVRRWTRSPNLWRRRASLYAMNRLVRAGELDRPFVIIRSLHRDPEFWVRRAVGTWLRECWKQDRPRTERFLLSHARNLAPIVITVATERASPAFRDRLRAEARPWRLKV